MVILYQFLQNYFKGVEDLLNLFKIMPLDHRVKISTVNPEGVVEILEDSKIFVAAMYPTMVWNLGRYSFFFQFTMPFSRLPFNQLVVFFRWRWFYWAYFLFHSHLHKINEKLQTIVLFFNYETNQSLQELTIADFFQCRFIQSM